MYRERAHARSKFQERRRRQHARRALYGNQSAKFAAENKNAKTIVDTNAKRVSIPNMVRIFATALLLSATAVFAQTNPTAYDALRTVGNQVNRDFVNRVVSVTGVEGNPQPDRKSTRLNSSHLVISYAVFCLKKKN